MQYVFSDRISALKPSAIREILKVTQDPTVISFAAGSPAPETFPKEEMAAIADDLFKTQSSIALQYGMTEGDTALRQLTFKRLAERYGIGKDFDKLVITTGGQQAIELAAKVLLNENDVVICEDPSFVGALNAFRSFRANLVSCPMDDDGMMTDELEKLLKTTKNVKMIYTIPTFQNPSGRTLSLIRRKKMLELAEKYNVIILEDNPYFELRYSGEPVPAIKSFDENGHVIYVGSYSKVLSPGIRIGYVLGPEEIVSKMIVCKQVSDVHTNLFFQMIVAEYLKKYDIDKHIESIRLLYRHKRDIMLASCEEHFDERVTVTRPDGGLFIWAAMPEGCDGMEFCRRAGKNKVAAVPGVTFSVDENQINRCFRMNFSLATDEQIKNGIAIMGKVMKQYLNEVFAK